MIYGSGSMEFSKCNSFIISEDFDLLANLYIHSLIFFSILMMVCIINAYLISFFFLFPLFSIAISPLSQHHYCLNFLVCYGKLLFPPLLNNSFIPFFLKDLSQFPWNRSYLLSILIYEKYQRKYLGMFIWLVTSIRADNS